MASILFIKSGLHCGRFAPLHNPQFHFIKSPPDLIWVRPTLIMTEGHNFNYLLFSTRSKCRTSNLSKYKQGLKFHKYLWFYFDNNSLISSFGKTNTWYYTSTLYFVFSCTVLIHFQGRYLGYNSPCQTGSNSRVRGQKYTTR